MSKEHILACLSSSPSNETLLKTAAELARVSEGTLTALYVEAPSKSGKKGSEALDRHIRLAESLGANIERDFGTDIPGTIARYARQNAVTKIVIGQSAPPRFRWIRTRSITDRILEEKLPASLVVVPAKGSAARYHMNLNRRPEEPLHAGLRDYIQIIVTLAGATLLSRGFQRLGVHVSNIATLYILAVLIISILTSRRLLGILSSLLSIIIFNFFFIKPFLSFQFYSPSYLVTFGVMLIAAVISGQLAARLKNYAEHAERSAYRMSILLDTSQSLQKTQGEKNILNTAGRQIVRLVGRSILVCPPEKGGPGRPYLLDEDEVRPVGSLEGVDGEAVRWCWMNGNQTGAGSDQYPGARYCYLPVATRGNRFGVIGLPSRETYISPYARSICQSILSECALAAENEKNAREKEETKLIAKNAELRADLLRSLSHDLRTPLTSIYGNADNLLVNGPSLSGGEKQRIYQDIYDDAEWLTNMVENLLAVTRLVNGTVHVAKNVEVVDDVIDEAVRHVDREISEHRLEVLHGDDILLARMDARLISQVIINLINNAVKYTPKGSVIRVSARRKGAQVEVEVADNGPGLSDDVKSHAFEMFYTGSRKVADSKRSLGLGLALCRSIIGEHGGTIRAANRPEGGAVFTFTLPAVDVPSDVTDGE